MRRAYAFWHEFESLAGTRLLHLNGILEIGPPDAEIVRGTLAATQRHDLTPEILDARMLMRRYPAFRLPHDWVGVLQRDGGVIEARKAIETNISVATERSARVMVNEKVLAIEPRGNGVRVITGSNKIDADAAIVSGGPWMRSLVPELAPLLRITRQVTAWLAPEDAAQFAADRLGIGRRRRNRPARQLDGEGRIPARRSRQLQLRHRMQHLPDRQCLATRERVPRRRELPFRLEQVAPPTEV
jgi:sarcosine oxidase